KAASKMFRKEAVCAVGLAWILAVLAGSAPYLLMGGIDFDDAVFESASGFTSTGATVLSDVEDLPRSLLFWRALTQWIGGLGIIVFFVALLSTLGRGAKTIYSRESQIDSSSFSGNLRVVIFKIFAIYLALSGLCFGAFYLSGLDVFGAAGTMLTTVSTGGFSVYNNGFGSLSNGAKWAAVLFMFIGGVNFALLPSLFALNLKKILRNSEFKAYVAVIAAVSASIFVSLTNFKGDFSDIFKSFTNTVFHVVSTTTSTGFSNVDYQEWGPLAHMLLFFIMIVGGCSASTSGGLKVVRALSAVKIGFRAVEKSFRPNVVRPVMLDGKAMEESRANEIMSFIAMYSIIAVAGMLALAFFEKDLSLETCITTIVSAISNIGPAFNETGPSQNFAFLATPSKALLSILMIMGRLEFYAVFALFMPDLWRKFR
ncbi:MAG: TrkH family potassium uptake protein, partial [Opitutales bacterium]|nr:TrkH family potassium uptake protein [Opitutales bacterium]